MSENGEEKALSKPKPELSPAVRPTGGLIPSTMDQLWRMANMITQAKMVPKSLLGSSIDETTSKVAVSIQMGLEVGLSPMMAVQNIAVINNMPSLWGDAALGLVYQSSVYVPGSFKEWMEGEPFTDAWTAYAQVQRHGDTEPTVQSFSWAEAKRAGLTKKPGPWESYPRRMMQMRPRSWVLRDRFADVLKGLRLTEEAMDGVIEMVEAAPGQFAAQDDSQATTKDILKQKAAEITGKDAENGSTTPSEPPQNGEHKNGKGFIGGDAANELKKTFEAVGLDFSEYIQSAFGKKVAGKLTQSEAEQAYAFAKSTAKERYGLGSTPETPIEPEPVVDPIDQKEPPIQDEPPFNLDGSEEPQPWKPTEQRAEVLQTAGLTVDAARKYFASEGFEFHDEIEDIIGAALKSQNEWSKLKDNIKRFV